MNAVSLALASADRAFLTHLFELGVLEPIVPSQMDLSNGDVIVCCADADQAEDIRRRVDEMIDLSKRLHGINKLIIMNHTDCGAYGGRAAFESGEAENAQHKTDLAKAAEMVKETHPDLEVEQVLVHIEDDGSINIENVA